MLASSLRKGNMSTRKPLYVVINAESFIPAGHADTQVDMREEATAEDAQAKRPREVERATVEDASISSYTGGDGFHLENAEYDQSRCSRTHRRQAAYLHHEGRESRRTKNGDLVVLPQKVVLEVTDTEPTTKGQTASSSYKPATLSNGVRTNVPPFIAIGTRIVVMTADGSYVERAKD